MAKKSKQTQAWQSWKSRECLEGAKAEPWSSKNLIYRNKALSSESKLIAKGFVVQQETLRDSLLHKKTLTCQRCSCFLIRFGHTGSILADPGK